MFTLSDGTNANRLSVSVSSEPEKMLLNPRATMLDCISPPRATSMPGRAATWSATVMLGRSFTSTAFTTDTEAGASMTFSGAREAVVGHLGNLPRLRLGQARIGRDQSERGVPARTLRNNRRPGSQKLARVGEGLAIGGALAGDDLSG